MNSGIFAWRWLLAARPEYVMSVMIELRDAWVWTIEVLIIILILFSCFFLPLLTPLSRNASVSSLTLNAPLPLSLLSNLALVAPSIPKNINKERVTLLLTDFLLIGFWNSFQLCCQEGEEREERKKRE